MFGYLDIINIILLLRMKSLNRWKIKIDKIATIWHGTQYVSAMRIKSS